MQRKMGCFGNSRPTKRCLKLRTCLKSPHDNAVGELQVSRHQKPISPGLQGPLKLDSQALAAFGATRVDHCATTTGFHANQKTMGTGAADFGGLVSAFHVKFLTGSVCIHAHQEA
jgi:hypothetical protein